jgi:hypothetical protein
MGRELRMVPPNWSHPIVTRRNGREGYQPMHKGSFDEASAEWKSEFLKWESGERPDYCTGDSRAMEYWEWAGGPPKDREFYCPWKPEDATWFQVWETVSEGTPVTPPFATKQELIEYLVENGDFWDQSRRKQGNSVMSCEPWSRRAAENFVNGPGYAPSFVLDGNGFRSGVQAMAESKTGTID